MAEAGNVREDCFGLSKVEGLGKSTKSVLVKTIPGRSMQGKRQRSNWKDEEEGIPSFDVDAPRRLHECKSSGRTVHRTALQRDGQLLIDSGLRSVRRDFQLVGLVVASTTAILSGT